MTERTAPYGEHLETTPDQHRGRCVHTHLTPGAPQ